MQAAARVPPAANRHRRKKLLRSSPFLSMAVIFFGSFAPERMFSIGYFIPVNAIPRMK